MSPPFNNLQRTLLTSKSICEDAGSQIFAALICARGYVGVPAPGPLYTSAFTCPTPNASVKKLAPTKADSLYDIFFIFISLRSYRLHQF